MKNNTMGVNKMNKADILYNRLNFILMQTNYSLNLSIGEVREALLRLIDDEVKIDNGELCEDCKENEKAKRKPGRPRKAGRPRKKR